MEQVGSRQIKIKTVTFLLSLSALFPAQVSRDHHGPRGTHDILCSVPLTKGPGHQVVCSGDEIYYDLQGELSVRSFDIRLTDYLGRAADLKGRPLALQITFKA